MISLKVLGGIALESDGAPLRGRIVQRRRLALLAILAAARTRPISRDRLVALLWPESRDDQARALLSDSLYVIRKALGDDVLLNSGDDLSLNSERIATDLARFEDALEAGDAEQAVTEYAGPFLDGVHVADAPEFERWTAEMRAQLQRRYAQAIDRLAADREQRSDHAGAVESLGRLAALDPGDARVTVRLMLALERAGNVPAALQAARVHETLMREDVGRGPAPEVEALAARLRNDPEPRIQFDTGTDSASSPPPVGSDVVRQPALPDVPNHPAARRMPATTIGATLGIVATIGLAVLLATNAASPLRGSAAGAVSDSAAGPHAVDRPLRVAVLPFAVRSGDHGAYLRDAVASLLAAKLDAAGRLQSVDPNLVFGRADAERQPLDPGQAITLGRALAADYVILGDAVEAGGRLQVTAAMYPVASARTGGTIETIAHATAEGPAGGIFNAVDTLTVHLLSAQQASAGQSLTSAAVLTTGSLPALKMYLSGEAAYREGRYPAAAEAFEAATRLDTTFALAYLRLGAAQSWMQRGAGGPARREATRLRDRLPPRYRVLADVDLAFQDGDIDEAERVLRGAVARYPDEPQYWFQLGEVLLHDNPVRGRSLTEAKEPFERAVALLHDERQGEPLLHLFQLALRSGDHHAIDSLARRYLSAQPRGEYAPSIRLSRALALGDDADLTRLADTLRTMDPAQATYAVAWASACTPDLRRLSPLLQMLVDSARTPAARATWLEIDGRVEVGRGRWRQARNALAALAAFDSRRGAVLRAGYYLTPDALVSESDLRESRDALARALATGRRDTVVAPSDAMRDHYLLGALHAATGGYADALREAAWIDSASRNVPGRWEAAFADELRARVAAEREGPAAALAALHERYPERLVQRRLLRAELLERLGRDDEALRWYESADSERGYGVTRLAPVRLRMARILQRRGDHRAAATYLAIAALRWNEADPELAALVNAARTSGDVSTRGAR